MRRFRFLLVVLALCVGALGSASAASAQQPAVEWSTAAITNGPCVGPSGSYCTFYRSYVDGTFTLTGFGVQDGELVAVGLASGTFRHAYWGVVAFSNVSATLPVRDIAATCESAVLTVGSNPPDPANSVWDPLPEVLTFTLGGGVETISVGVLPTTLTASSPSGALCRLSRVAKTENPHALAGVLNSFVR